MRDFVLQAWINNEHDACGVLQSLVSFSADAPES